MSLTQTEKIYLECLKSCIKKAKKPRKSSRRRRASSSKKKSSRRTSGLNYCSKKHKRVYLNKIFIICNLYVCSNK